MISSSFIPPALAALGFLLIVFYQWKYQVVISLADLIKCLLAALAIPHLARCLYYLITDPEVAILLPQSTEYLTIAVLVLFYVTGKELHRIIRQ